MNNFLRATALTTLAGVAAALTGCAGSDKVRVMYLENRHGQIVGANGAVIDPKAGQEQQASSGYKEPDVKGDWHFATNYKRDSKGQLIWWMEQETYPGQWVPNKQDCELVGGLRVDNGVTTRGGFKLPSRLACTVEQSEFNSEMVQDRAYTELLSDMFHVGIGIELTNRKPDETNISNNGGNVSAETSSTGGSVGDVTNTQSQEQSQKQKQDQGQYQKSTNVNDNTNVNKWDNTNFIKQETDVRNTQPSRPGHDNHGKNGNHGGCNKKDKHGRSTCAFFRPTLDLA